MHNAPLHASADQAGGLSGCGETLGRAGLGDLQGAEKAVLRHRVPAAGAGCWAGLSAAELVSHQKAAAAAAAIAQARAEAELDLDQDSSDFLDGT